MGWYEVECKIKIDDADEIRKKINEIAKFAKNEKKVDDYYSLEYFNYPDKSLRVRNKGKKREVNFKRRKSYVEGIHAKNEFQFGITDLKGFFELIEDFGFRKWMHKEKKTELYITKDGVNIELNHVDRLGWYIEIEILCDEEGIKNARKKIAAVRNKLGFGSRDSEKRGYTKMLWDAQNK